MFLLPPKELHNLQSRMLAPFIGGFTVKSYLGWRFNGYWSVIMGFLTFIAMAFFMKETYPPTILVSKAKLLRRSTKNWAIHAKHEEVEINIQELLSKNLSRPMRMFLTEPIVAAITIYLSFVYGLLYTYSAPDCLPRRKFPSTYVPLPWLLRRHTSTPIYLRS